MFGDGAGRADRRFPAESPGSWIWARTNRSDQVLDNRGSLAAALSLLFLNSSRVAIHACLFVHPAMVRSLAGHGTARLYVYRMHHAVRESDGFVYYNSQAVFFA